MSHHDVENNPVKEILTAVIGLVPLIVIIAGIAVFAWIRPAGQHAPAVSSDTPAATATAEAPKQQ